MRLTDWNGCLQISACILTAVEQRSLNMRDGHGLIGTLHLVDYLIFEGSGEYDVGILTVVVFVVLVVVVVADIIFVNISKKNLIYPHLNLKYDTFVISIHRIEIISQYPYICSCSLWEKRNFWNPVAKFDKQPFYLSTYKWTSFGTWRGFSYQPFRFFVRNVKRRHLIQGAFAPPVLWRWVNTWKYLQILESSQIVGDIIAASDYWQQYS